MTNDRLEKIPTQSLAEQALAMIRNAIFEGKIQPEERLTIEQIASELGISRTPVREALKQLESDGIVRILPNRGAVVQRFDKDELDERYCLRAMLEGYAAERACRKQGAGLADQLEANCVAMQAGIKRLAQLDKEGKGELDQISHLLSLNREFHDCIVEAAGGTMIAKMLNSMQMPLAYRLYQWRVPARRQAVLEHHRQVAAAFRDGKPRQARKLMEEHIHDVRDFLLSIDDAAPPARRPAR